MIFIFDLFSLFEGFVWGQPSVPQASAQLPASTAPAGSNWANFGPTPTPAVQQQQQQPVANPWGQPMAVAAPMSQNHQQQFGFPQSAPVPAPAPTSAMGNGGFFGNSGGGNSNPWAGAAPSSGFGGQFMATGSSPNPFAVSSIEDDLFVYLS